MNKKNDEQRQWKLCYDKRVKTSVQKNENTSLKFDVISY